MTTHEEQQAQRFEALRRLGAKIVWLTCAHCRTSFVDWERLGGRVWCVKKVTRRNYRFPGKHGLYCSRSCAEAGLLKVSADAAWVEGYEP